MGSEEGGLRDKCHSHHLTEGYTPSVGPINIAVDLDHLANVEFVGFLHYKVTGFFQDMLFLKMSYIRKCLHGKGRK